MVYAILLSEFDIDKGSQLSEIYPWKGIGSSQSPSSSSLSSFSSSESAPSPSSKETFEKQGFLLDSLDQRERDLLAELMLPDGAHQRDQDWTYFFIDLPHKSSKALTKVKLSTSPIVKTIYEFDRDKGKLVLSLQPF